MPLNKNETKRERFARIAPYRTQKLLHQINVLSRCSRSEIYDYHPKEIAAIFKAIRDALDTAEKMFEPAPVVKTPKFELPKIDRSV